jgi:hypothetical protein
VSLLLRAVGDFSKDLNVSGEKGDSGTGAYNGCGNADDASRWPAKRFSFHIETNDRTTRITPRNTIGVHFFSCLSIYDRYSVTIRGYFSDKLVDQRLGYSENMLLSFFF